MGKWSEAYKGLWVSGAKHIKGLWVSRAKHMGYGKVERSIKRRRRNKKKTHTFMIDANKIERQRIGSGTKWNGLAGLKGR
jgi:hypothetical protein